MYVMDFIVTKFSAISIILFRQSDTSDPSDPSCGYVECRQSESICGNQCFSGLQVSHMFFLILCGLVNKSLVNNGVNCDIMTWML